MLLSLLQKRSKHSGQIAVASALVIIPVFAIVTRAVDAHGISEQPEMVQMADNHATRHEANLVCL